MRFPVASTLLIALLTSCASSRTTAEVGVGAGSYGISVDGLGSSSTNAGLFELALESVSASHIGGGARLRGIGSGDDLQLDDPTTPLPSDGEPLQAGDGLFYVHATYDPGEGAKRLPIRFGLASNVLDVEGQLTGDTLTASSFGPRFEFAPQLPLTKSDGFSLAATGLLGLGYGFTSIEENDSVGDWSTNAFFYDLGIGLRADFKNVYLDLGFRYLGSSYSESDESLGVVIRAVDTDFTGVVLGLGAKF